MQESESFLRQPDANPIFDEDLRTSGEVTIFGLRLIGVVSKQHYKRRAYFAVIKKARGQELRAGLSR
jgi:hypothetical protein